VVVEANPFCLPSLHRNRTLNECKFLVEHCAVSNQPAITFFLHPKYIVGSNAHLRTANPVSVPGRSLPELAERYGPFTVLIIDIEGSELEALRAHGEKLRQFRLVIIELHDWVIGTAGVEECRRILNVHGFKLIAHSQITEAWARS
jgi:FkbM family methyltransferase